MTDARAGADYSGPDSSQPGTPGQDAELTVSYTLPERGLDIDFTVPTSGITAVIGHNGAGKSTTFDVISGLLAPPRAVVTLGEETLTRLGVDAKVFVPPHRRQIVQLAQRARLFPTMTVLDNAAFGLRARGVPTDQARARAQAMLTELEAGELVRRRPAELSGGQAQRVAIARALVTEPKLLLLDEPAAGLDRASAAAVRELFARIAQTTPTLLISHDEAEVAHLAARTVLLERGRVAEIR